MALCDNAQPSYVETQASVRIMLSSLNVAGTALGQLRPQYLRIIDVLREGHRLSTGESVNR